MRTLPSSHATRSDDRDAVARRVALAAWYGVPAETFRGFSSTAVEEILDAIRDTPSRWAGIPRTTGEGR